MIEREIFYKGQLVITKVSGIVKGQELIDHVFWLIDSHNIGEVQSDYDQVVYVDNIETLNVQEEDVERITEISTGLGQSRGDFRTVIIASRPEDIKLAQFYKQLVKESGREVEVCENFEQAFNWLGCENPEPDKYK